MKHRLLLCATVLLALSSSYGQLMSSHAPTGISPLPKAKVATNEGGVMMRVTGKPVARVNGVVLTDRELLSEMYAIFPYARVHKGFPKAEEPAIRRGALQMLIFEEEVYQEARRQRLSITKAELKAAKKQFMTQFPGPREYQAFLRQEMDGSEAKLDHQIERSLLIDRFLKREVGDKSKVTDAEARAYYKKHPKMFHHGELYMIQSISVIPPATSSPDTLAEAKQHAEELEKKAKATKTYKEFGLLAERYSDDDYRVNYGDHKIMEADKVPEPIRQAAAKMKIGQVSGLIQLGHDYTIVRLNGHMPAGMIPFAKVKIKLKNNLQKQKYERLRSALSKRLSKKDKVEKL